MKLKLLRHPRRPLRAALMAAAAFLAALAPAHGFVTDNKTVTTFDTLGQRDAANADVRVTFTTFSTEEPPTAYFKDLSSQQGPPGLITGGTVGADHTFIATRKNIIGDKQPWELAIQYLNTGDINSLSTIALAVGTFTYSGQSAEWIASSTDMHTNVRFTASINTTVGGTVGDDGKIDGGEHRNLGTLEGYLYDPSFTSWMGTGADKKIVTLTLTNGEEAIDLSGYDNYCVHIQAHLTTTDKQSVPSGMGVGFGSIVYQSETVVNGFIWRGTNTNHNWNYTSNDWDKLVTDPQTLEETITHNETFETGYYALFDGKDDNHVVVFDTPDPIMAASILITDGEYTFNMQDGAAPTAKVLDLRSDTSQLNISGTDKVLAVDSVVGKGTIGKTGTGKTTLKASKAEDAAGGAFTEFSGNIKVSSGVLEIQSATGLTVKDVILDGGELLLKNTEAAVGWQKMEVSGTLKGGAAGTGASGNITLASGAVLDASDAAGTGGIDLAGNITLNSGNIILSSADMDLISNLDFGGMYDLFHDVTNFTVGSETIEPGTWVKASDVFSNDLFKGDKEYYLFYSGTSEGGKGGNVGAIYLMQIPEPTTGTLSLLALAGLAARRRRKGGMQQDNTRYF